MVIRHNFAAIFFVTEWGALLLMLLFEGSSCGGGILRFDGEKSLFYLSRFTAGCR